MVVHGNVPTAEYSNTLPDKKLSVHHDHVTKYPDHHFKYSHPDGYVIDTSVGGVLSMTNRFPVNVAVLPARSVAMILTLASVLSTTGNIREKDQLFAVPELMVA
jgi:hypothetical protein